MLLKVGRFRGSTIEHMYVEHVYEAGMGDRL
jgi:hypothetical protein